MTNGMLIKRKFVNEDSLSSNMDLLDYPTSPTTTSEDSVEVKIHPIGVPSVGDNVRRSSSSYPPKKRLCLKIRTTDQINNGDKIDTHDRPPFRPWSPPSSADNGRPMALVVERRVPIHPPPSQVLPSVAADADAHSVTDSVAMRRDQRNYKNMTRERRIEANARERTRVHTISAAFDTLRHAIPSYSHNQKLSKLSVLRIACAYITTLSNIVDDGGATSTNINNNSNNNNNKKINDCIEIVTKTIQREGKLRKKKDDND